MRDWSVKTLYLKSDKYPEITFEILKIGGESISKALRPLNKNVDIKADPQNMTVDILIPDKENAPLVLRLGGEELLVDGKLREDILNAINADNGEIHVTGRLTVAGGAKDFDTAVAFKKIGNNEFVISAIINAAFTDFGMTAPNLSWFIAVHNKLILKGHAIIQVLK